MAAKWRSVVLATSTGPLAMLPSGLLLMGNAPAPLSFGLPALVRRACTACHAALEAAGIPRSCTPFATLAMWLAL
eukprot:2079081-Lingulodinium_polyedra.AAC.1